uniref:Uncharacterized protein n=2 Tax=Moniliophthora roreri TaxID=221103 RepID=A0A0W0F3J6_MONRR
MDKCSDYTSSNQAQMAKVCATIVHDNWQNGKGLIAAKELMIQLQKSNAAILGNSSVILTFHNDEKANWEIKFCKGFNPKHPEQSEYDPPYLLANANNSDLADLVPIYLDVTANTSIKGSGKGKQNGRGGKPENINWVRQKLQQMTGWQDFQDK